MVNLLQSSMTQYSGSGGRIKSLHILIVDLHVPVPLGHLVCPTFKNLGDVTEVYLSIRLSRICLTLSLARIYLPGHPYRRVALSFCAILVILYFTCIFVTTFRCPGARGSWYIINVQTCASSSVIIGTPVTLFARKLPQNPYIKVQITYFV